MIKSRATMDKAAAHALLLRVQHRPLCADSERSCMSEEEPEGSIVLRGIRMKEVIISVIMPAYNCAPYIEKAIRSVQEQVVPWELIIIDDASRDLTEKVIQPYLEDRRIQYYRNDRNMGVSYSRNRGVSYASGKYVAYLDADDWWEKEKLIRQIQILREHKAVICYTGRGLYSEDGTFTGKKISVPQKVNYEKLLYTNCIPCSSVVLTTKVAKEFPMDHDELHEDYLNWLRITKEYGCAYGINEPLLKSRLTLSGKSQDKRKTIKMTYGVYRQMEIKKTRAVMYTISHLILSLVRYW